jgi:hypothetical protein
MSLTRQLVRILSQRIRVGTNLSPSLRYLNDLDHRRRQAHNRCRIDALVSRYPIMQRVEAAAGGRA